MVASPTLNLTLSNTITTGAKPIYYSNKGGLNQSSTVTIQAGAFLGLIYDAINSRWVSIGQVDTNTTYNIITQAEIDAGTSTNTRVVTPKLLRDNFYTETEVNALIPTVPTNVSDFTNDAGYLTTIPELTDSDFNEICV